MGIIQRQGIKHLMVTYGGIVLGALSTLFVYPLDKEMYGLAQFIIPTAMFLLPFAAFGIHTLPVRFFPDFKDPARRHHGFLGLLLLLLLIGFSVFVLLTLAFEDSVLQLLDLLGFEKDRFTDNAPYIILVTFFLLLSSVIVTYTSNFQRIVIPSMLQNLTMKIGLPVLILLFFYGVMEQVAFKWALVLLHVVITVGVIIYLKRLGHFSLTVDLGFLRQRRALMKRMMTFSFYGILGSSTSVLAMQIDKIMVSGLEGFSENGTYSILMFMSNVIAVPAASIIRISAPIISDAWNQDDRQKILGIYRRSSEILFAIGLLFFLIIWCSIDSILQLTSDYQGLVVAKDVVLFLGLAKVIDMLTSVNTDVINLSKYYRFNLVAVAFLAVINVLANLYFIPRHGIVGAAMATAISLTLFNLVKYLFILIQFKMQPFSRATLKILLLGLLTYAVTLLLPTTGTPLLDILIQSSVIAMIFGGAIVRLNISPEVTGFYLKTRARAKKWLGK